MSFDLLLPSGIKMFKMYSGDFKEESDEISSIPPTVFFEKNFWKFLENSQKNIRDRAHI